LQEFHLSGSRGNFAWLSLGAGLSLARTALSASGRVLSSVNADDLFIDPIIAKKTASVKQNKDKIRIPSLFTIGDGRQQTQF
jgi:hypothetical protein